MAVFFSKAGPDSSNASLQVTTSCLIFHHYLVAVVANVFSLILVFSMLLLYLFQSVLIFLCFLFLSWFTKSHLFTTVTFRSVAEMDNGGGIVYNQLGLLIQDSEPIKALLYFFLAYSFPNRPFHGAFANILGLLAKKTAILDDPVVAVIEHCLTTFRYFLNLF